MAAAGRSSTRRATRATQIIAGAVIETEEQFQQDIIDLAKLTGWRWYHTHDARRSVPGFPDLVLLRPPEHLVVECKMNHRQPTPDQWVWLYAFADCGVEAYVWQPRDWDDIVGRLSRYPRLDSLNRRMDGDDGDTQKALRCPHK